MSKPLDTSPATNRIMKEIAQMANDPLPNCSANPRCAGNIRKWSATICGPPETPYEGGVFKLDIHIPLEYPFKPPKVTFRTRIYHCNINDDGFICLDILKENWSPALTISAILLSISSLLAECNPYDPIVTNIARQYLKNRELHDYTARLWTQRYAM